VNTRDTNRNEYCIVVVSSKTGLKRSWRFDLRHLSESSALTPCLHECGV
jgi:hypothetical protein